MMGKATTVPFGHPDSIQPRKLFTLPLPMQAEGLRLLFEMGQSMEQVCARTGLSASAIRNLVRTRHAPFTRGGEAYAVAAEEEV